MDARGPAPLSQETEDLEIAGRRLHTLHLKPAHLRASEPLVFLHEGLGSTSLWRDFPAALCTRLGRDGLVYDREGHGRSDPLSRPRDAGYLHEQAEQVLPKLLAATGIDHPILIGHSDGGTIALLYAAAFPDRPAAIITEAAHVLVEPLTLQGIDAAVHAWQMTDLCTRLERHHGEKTKTLFHAWADLWRSPGFRDWNIETALPAIRCPTLVLQGSLDEYGTMAQVEAIARGVGGPVETAIIEGAKHVPHHQARDAVIQRIEMFLDHHLPHP